MAFLDEWGLAHFWNKIKAYVDGKVGSESESEEVYSTEEVRIGTWIDGKPLYRKCYQSVSIANSEPIDISNLSALNIDEVILMTSVSKYPHNNSYSPSGYFNPSQSTGVWVWIGSGYTLKCRSSAAAGNQIIINTVIEYTKTTD